MAAKKSKAIFPSHVEAVRLLSQRLIKYSRVAAEIADEMVRRTKAMKTKGHEDMAAAWAFMRDADDAIDEMRKALHASVDAIGHSTDGGLPGRLDAANVKTFTMDHVGRFTRTERYVASVIPEAREEAFAWLRKNGGGDLIKPTVNAQSLSGFGRELLEEKGKDLPDKLFKVTLIPGVSFTPIKGK